MGCGCEEDANPEASCQLYSTFSNRAELQSMAANIRSVMMWHAVALHAAFNPGTVDAPPRESMEIRFAGFY